MICQDIIYRIFDKDPTSGITLFLASMCVDKMEPSKVSPEEISRIFGVLGEVSKNLVTEIEKNQTRIKDKLVVDNIHKSIGSVSSVSSLNQASPSGSFLRKTNKC